MIFLAAYAKTSTEVRYLPADDAGGGAHASSCRASPATSTTSITTTARFYITTNKGAKNFKVVTAPIADPSEKNWTAFIDHNPAIKINGAHASSPNHLVVSEREGGLSYLRVIDLKTQAVAPHRDRRAGLRAVARRPIPSSTRRRSASTTSRW